MISRRHLTNLEVRRIAEMARARRPPMEIARELHRARSTVKQVLSTLPGIPPCEGAHLRPHEIQAIRDLRAEGLPLHEVAERLGRSERTVWRADKRARDRDAAR